MKWYAISVLTLAIVMLLPLAPPAEAQSSCSLPFCCACEFRENHGIYICDLVDSSAGCYCNFPPGGCYAPGLCDPEGWIS